MSDSPISRPHSSKSMDFKLSHITDSPVVYLKKKKKSQAGFKIKTVHFILYYSLARFNHCLPPTSQLSWNLDMDDKWSEISCAEAYLCAITTLLSCADWGSWPACGTEPSTGAGHSSHRAGNQVAQERRTQVKTSMPRIRKELRCSRSTTAQKLTTVYPHSLLQLLYINSGKQSRHNREIPNNAF